MEQVIETQEKVVSETVPDRQLDREKAIDQHFASIDAALAKQPTKEDFDKIVLEMQTFMTQVNVYIKTFSLGVDIIAKSSKFVFFAVIAAGSIGAGIIALKGGLFAVLGWLGFTRL